MAKRLVLALVLIFMQCNLSYGIDAWIRINQLGYLPNAQKKAVFVSESEHKITQFSIHDALTSELLMELSTVKSYGQFQLFKSTYILDFSSFKKQGAFYIKAGLVYSPSIYINKNTYLGTADFLLNYLRNSRGESNFNSGATGLKMYGLDVNASLIAASDISKQEINGSSKLTANTSTSKSSDKSTSKSSDKTTNKSSDKSTVKSSTNSTSEATTKATTNNSTTKISTKPSTKSTSKASGKQSTQALPLTLEVSGGWHKSGNYTQNAAISANTVFQLMFAYQTSPASFSDKHDANGKTISNGVPDILDEAKWGLDWLLKMYPHKDKLYHQVIDTTLHSTNALSTMAIGTAGAQQSQPLLYLATGKPQGLMGKKNQTTGIASIAGKYASAFALGANLFSKYLPNYADSLNIKAIDAYLLGKKNEGVCQTLPNKIPYNYEESNWVDDMELAATQLYRLSYESNYIKDAANYGRMEPITPWMFSDTARHYQWFPFLNIGHYMLANVENPRYQNEFLLNMKYGIERVRLNAVENPFNIGVPMIMSSNSLVIAAATQCILYRTLSKDSSYIDMETAMVDWLLGCNPWGTSMVVGLPEKAVSPTNLYGYVPSNNNSRLNGALVNGPVGAKVFHQVADINVTNSDVFDRFQTPLAVYHDNSQDFATNMPSLDATAAFTHLLSYKQLEGVPNKTVDKNQYTNGSITRTDDTKKQISLVFTGHQYADGYKTIGKTLRKLNIKASFFFTGDFYRTRKFKNILKAIKEDKHYLGASSDKNRLYCSFQHADSLLVDKATFIEDVKANYAAMTNFSINKSDAPFFLPAYECNNDSISQWCKELGLIVVNSTAGTLSNADASTPEMREKYFSTGEIYNRIIKIHKNEGLNGYILQFHIGADKRREDKFYKRLLPLLAELKQAGYEFVDLYTATDKVDKEVEIIDKASKAGKNKKRKN